MLQQLLGSLFSGRSSMIPPHRRNRVNPRRFLSFLFEYFGDQLYYLGASIERGFRNGIRSIRKGSKRLFFAFLGLLKTVFTYVVHIVSRAFEDLTNPFRKFVRSVRSLSIVLRDTKNRSKEARRRRLLDFFKYGWIWNRHLIGRMLNHLLPALALILAVLTISRVLGQNFVLAVNYNGENVGFVQNEQIFQAAQRIVEERIVYTDEEAIDWSPDADLKMAVAAPAELLTQSGMADALLRASGEEIQEATGLYIDGDFYGAVSDGEALRAELDGILEPYKEQVEGEDINVHFKNAVELVKGVYPTESVRALSEMEDEVHSDRGEVLYYSVNAGDTAESIAEQNGLTVERLQFLNPEIDFSKNLAPGGQVMLYSAEPLLSVKVVRTELIREAIPVETVEQLNPLFDRRYEQVLVEGKEGEKEVSYEVEFENGVEVARTVIGEVEIVPMVREIIVRGNKSYTVTYQPNLQQSLGGELLWPTGPFIYVSRGWIDGHRAIDIAGFYDTPIYAAADGVVTTSGWTDTGYGYYIIVDHGNGMETLYGHCNSLIAQVGDRVSRGQLIALMGTTGYSTGVHLHFEVRIGGERVPTEPYLGLGMAPG